MKNRRIIENIKKSNIKLIELIENAAKLAKLESTEEMAFVRTDITSVINTVLKNFEQDLNCKNIEIIFENPGPFFALANPMIEGVFTNIISNAIKYSPDTTTITVRIEDLLTNGKYLWLTRETEYQMLTKKLYSPALTDYTRKILKAAVSGLPL
ncbi:signal transduction histidine kinase [Methanolobus bombayensis]|nr:hypothetical protein [Methanolobus bombayensis]MBP1909759.1 signal transduction histidine kinase [Methanolobus bombayensis]